MPKKHALQDNKQEGFRIRYSVLALSENGDAKN
jgi:hypothetical protein